MANLFAVVEGRYFAPSPIGAISTAGWPHEPSGYTVLSDWDFGNAPPTSGDVPIPGSPGWHIVNNHPPGDMTYGWVAMGSDATAPTSPSAVYTFTFPVGFQMGNGVGTLYQVLFPTRLTLYWSFWIKYSTPFDLTYPGHKVGYVKMDPNAQMFMILGQDQLMRIYQQGPAPTWNGWFDPNVDTGVVTLNTWHQVEWLTDLTTSTLKWWIDGVLRGSYAEHLTTDNPITQLEFAPVYGGNGPVFKPQTDIISFDHQRFSTGG